MNELKPVLHRLLVKPDPVEKTTASGIVIALDERKEAKAGVTGVVVAVGSTAFIAFGTTAEEQGVVPGARIYYARYAGAQTKDEQHLFINDEDVLSVITEE